MSAREDVQSQQLIQQPKVRLNDAWQRWLQVPHGGSNVSAPWHPTQQFAKELTHYARVHFHWKYSTNNASIIDLNQCITHIITVMSVRSWYKACHSKYKTFMMWWGKFKSHTLSLWQNKHVKKQQQTLPCTEGVYVSFLICERFNSGVLLTYQMISQNRLKCMSYSTAKIYQLSWALP